MTRSSLQATRTRRCSRTRPRATCTRSKTGWTPAKFPDAARAAHRRTLIYFGRLAPHKRIPTTFALLRELRRTDPDWRLIVAGGEWETSIAELRTAAQTAGVGPAVEFFNEPSDMELRELIGGSSYFVSPSAYEGFGVAAVEALSAGLIPVLSTIPPFVKLLDRAGVGLSYDPAEPQAAAMLFNKSALSAATNIEPLRKRAMESAAAYDWGATTEKFASLYRAVLAPRAKGRATANSGA